MNQRTTNSENATAIDRIHKEVRLQQDAPGLSDFPVLTGILGSEALEDVKTNKNKAAADRAAAKEARAKAKAAIEIQKTKAKLARAKLNLAKMEQVEKKRQAARLWIPDVYPDWEQSQQIETKFSFDGFLRQHDPVQFEQVSKALDADTFAKVLDLLSDVFECDKTEICLLEDLTISRKGIKTSVVAFRYAYNPDFNDVLKATEQAGFDQGRKSWNVALDEDAQEAITESIGDFYSFVIDLSRLLILKNENTANLSTQTRLAFEKLPFHLPIRKFEVVAALRLARINDSILEDKLYLHDGSGFITYPDQDEFWTQSPFLLLRYAVDAGRPRYVSFSTLGMVAEYVSFGNHDKITSMAIARYTDTCRKLKLVLIESNETHSINGTADMRRQLQGGFDRFSKSIETIHSTISDVGLAPICSDYVTLLSQDHGADSVAADIIAYVIPTTPIDHYLAKITAFFGYAATDYPIIFTRSILNDWNEIEDSNFLLIAAHELAHWLVLENDGEFPDQSPHGVCWAVCQDLLEYLFTGKYSITAYRIYEPDEFKAIAAIEHMVNNVGIPSLNHVRSSRPLNKVDIKNATRECIVGVSGAIRLQS